MTTTASKKVAIIGYGYVGKAYHKMFADAVIYDEPLKIIQRGGKDVIIPNFKKIKGKTKLTSDFKIDSARDIVNECDLALVCVPTDLKDAQLDMSVVEEVVEWLETPLILIKSALQPGTVDRLVKETGKNIAVSVEMVGEGKYNIPFWKYPHPTNPSKHQFLIVGGEEETAKRCANIIWEKMSPDINIHLVSAIEAEICKLMENFWGAQKVTFANMMFDICEKLGANYTKVLQAWGSDGRVEKMHMRVLPYKRGWKSKCYDKDIPALAEFDDSGFAKAVIKANEKHLG